MRLRLGWLFAAVSLRAILGCSNDTLAKTDHDSASFSCICNDLNPCTDDLCLTTGECVHVDNRAPCDDGIFCNGADTCDGGVCGHAGDPCGAADPCGGAICDEAADQCVELAADPACSAVFDSLVAGGLQPSGNHTCGLTSSHQAYCWGTDRFGQLGDGMTSWPTGRFEPALVGDGLTFAQISAGVMHTCGVTLDGDGYCWGNDLMGQLGDGPDPVPEIEVSPSLLDITGVSFTEIAAGHFATCGIATSGDTYCWGGLGPGATPVFSPVLFDTAGIAFVSLAASPGAHFCGLTGTGAAYCWGVDQNGQLGNGDPDTDFRSTPVLVDTSAMLGSTTFVAVDAGTAHTCGLAADGIAYCWGAGSAIGRSGAGDSHRPLPVDTTRLGGSTSFTQIAAGSVHTCGIAAGGGVFCWGDDGVGQLGDGGDFSDQDIPTPLWTGGIFGASTFRHITAGSGHTCGIATDGIAYCWGSDIYGELGAGSEMTVWGWSSQGGKGPTRIDVSGM